MSSSDILHQLSSPSAATALLVAGLGAVFAFAQLGGPLRTEGDAEPEGGVGIGRHDAVTDTESKGSKAKASRRRKKGKDSETTGSGSGGQAKAAAKVTGRPGTGHLDVPSPNVVLPGDFEVTPAAAATDTDVDSTRSSLASRTPAREGNNANANVNATRKKQKQKKQTKGQVGNNEGKKESSKGRAPEHAHGPRSGDTTAAAPSASAAASAMTPASSSLGLPGDENVHASVNLAPPSQLTDARGLHPSPSFDTDSSWTHIPRRGNVAKKADSTGVPTLAVSTDVTSSDVGSTASNSPVIDMHDARGQGDQRTLAEKHLPKPRKTGVEDMLEQADYPTLARVMRVQPRADEIPVPGFSWEDYGDVVEEGAHVNDADEEDEGEWDVVTSKHRNSRTTSTSTPTPPPPQAQAQAAAAATASETMTKKQRQNAKKRELAKAAKAETETARLEGLAKHKRELEKQRIIDQSRQGGGKRPGGGMQATIDDRGKLVWE